MKFSLGKWKENRERNEQHSTQEKTQLMFLNFPPSWAQGWLHHKNLKPQPIALEKCLSFYQNFQSTEIFQINLKMFMGNV